MSDIKLGFELFSNNKKRYKYSLWNVYIIYFIYIYE